MTLKVCSKCNKKLTTDKFSKQSARKDGLSPWCKECTKEYKKIYNKKNEVAINEHKKDYYYKHLDLFKERRIRDAEDIKARSKKYHAENKEIENERCRKYKIKNKAKLAEYGKKRYAEVGTEYYKNHKEAITITLKKYRSKNKVKLNIITNKRRARKRKLLSTLTLNQWERIKSDFNDRCVYCGGKLPLEQEHFISLNQGGEYTTNNIICACRICNASKSNKDFFLWYPKQKSYSKKRETAILKYLNYKDNIQQLKLL